MTKQDEPPYRHKDQLPTEIYNKQFADGGREMMRIIISLIEGKLGASKACVEKSLVKDIDHHIGRSSAFKELLDILQRDLNMLEHKK